MTETTALASTTRPVGVPKGYLSIKELSEKYPDFHMDYMTSSDRDRPMRVWVDEKEPVYAKMSVKVEPELTDKQIEERRKMRGRTKFKMEEDRYIEELTMIPVHEEFPITISNFVYLWGDPNFRLDLGKKPEKAVDYVNGMSESRWKSYRIAALDRFRRNPSCQEGTRFTDKGEQEMPAKYAAKTFNINNTKLDLWNNMPPVYVMPPDNYRYTVKEEKTIEDQVMNALKECELSLTKAVYKDDEMLKVKGKLVDKGLVKDTASLTKIRSLVKMSQIEDGVKVEVEAEVDKTEHVEV